MQINTDTSKAKVNAKWGTEKDKMPDMTKAGLELTDAVLAHVKTLPKAHQKSVNEVLASLYNGRMKAGNKRVLTLTMPSLINQIAAHASKPE